MDTNNTFYMLKITDNIYDNITDFYFYKRKPSIATIKTKVACNFMTAEKIYKLEPLDYEYNELSITLQQIDEKWFEENITNKYEIYEDDNFEVSDVLDFIDNFKKEYHKELNELYNKLDTLLSIDELIYDWYADVDFQLDNYNETIEDFTKFIKNNFKFKDR